MQYHTLRFLRCILYSIFRHRHSTSHSCPVQETEPPLDNDMVQALLAAKFPSALKKIPVSLPSQRTPTNPKKIAQFQKVQLMKMRHHAEPGDLKDSARSVPLNQRLHVTVKTHDNPVQEKTFWFHKVSEVLGSLQDGHSSSAEQSIVAGKALDLISTQLGLSRSESSVRVIHSVFH